MHPSSERRGDLGALCRQVVDRKTGIVSRLLASPLRGGEIALAHVEARVADYSRLPSGGKILDTGGSGARLGDALACGLFEALERYAAAFVDRRRLVVARPTPGGPFLHGEAYPLFAASQYAIPGFPFRPLTERSEIWWAEGRSLASGRAAFVPAAMVFIPYTATSEDEWLGPGTSTGMAAGWSWTRACISGLLEVCERDAFMIAWLNRLSRPRLLVAPGSPFAAELERLLAHRRASVSFVDLTNDLGVPVVLAVLDSRLDGRRIVTVGAAARPTLLEAARKAVLEAVSDLLRLGIVLARPGEPWRAAPDFSNVTDFEFHSLVYVDPAQQPVLDFLTASAAELPLEQPSPLGAADDEALLAALVRRATARGLDPVVVTLTPPDLAPLGVHVVKVVIPGAVPMPPDHRYPWLGHRRAHDVPAALGLLPRPARPDELLLDHPHPFA